MSMQIASLISATKDEFQAATCASVRFDIKCVNLRLTPAYLCNYISRFKQLKTRFHAAYARK
ncbi:hypothetical protein Hanom_Chr04g00352051 [Helianthus anomalus]